MYGKISWVGFDMWNWLKVGEEGRYLLVWVVYELYIRFGLNVWGYIGISSFVLCCFLLGVNRLVMLNDFCFFW